MKKIGKVAIVGGTGMVGTELLKVMKRHELVPSKLIITGDRTVGQRKSTPYGQRMVKPSNLESCLGADLVFLAAGAEVSKELARPLLEADKNVRIIDLSSAFRYEPDVPLVIWSINGDTIGEARLIATPNCTTSIALMALAPLHQKKSPIKAISLVSYQAASGAGQDALADLEKQIKDWCTSGQAPQFGTTGKGHKYPLAGNLIPHIDIADPKWQGFTKEEMKFQWETNKILFRTRIDDLNVPISATCVRVPVRRCHSMVIHVRFNNILTRLDIKYCLVQTGMVKIIDDVANYQYPMPLNMEGEEKIGVGRIRYATLDHHEVLMWVVGDQLLRGAALSAVEIAENIF